MRIILFFILVLANLDTAYPQSKISFWRVEVEGNCHLTWDWNYKEVNPDYQNKGYQNQVFQGNYSFFCPKWAATMENDVLLIKSGTLEDRFPDDFTSNIKEGTWTVTGSSVMNTKVYDSTEDLRKDYKSFSESTNISQSSARVLNENPGFGLKIWINEGFVEGGVSVLTKMDDVSAKGESVISITDWEGKKTNRFPLDELVMKSNHEEFAIKLMQNSFSDREQSSNLDGLDAESFKLLEGMNLLSGDITWKSSVSKLANQNGFLIQTISGTKNFSVPYNEFFVDEKERSGQVNIILRQNIKITLKPYTSPEEEKYEAFIEPVNNELASYDQFIPQGRILDNSQNGIVPGIYSNTSDRGNSLEFKVTVYETKTKKQLPPDQYQTFFQLSNTSRYRGICNNFPILKNAPNTEPDFLFLSEMNNASDFEYLKADIAKTLRQKGDAKITLTSMDYAAFTNLEAEVYLHLEGGKTLIAKFKPDNRKVVRIPKDDNFNMISDAWENKTGVSNVTATWDEDPYPLNQRRNGDGYTLFEEYRGFHVVNNSQFNPKNTFWEKGHIRTDPNHKDVFIYDQDQLFKNHYSKFNPAQLNWHYILENQFNFNRASPMHPEHRWINFNTPGEYFYAKQYGMHLAIQGIEGSEEFNLGIARAGAPNLRDFQNQQDENSSLKNIRKIFGQIFDIMESPTFSKMLCAIPLNFDQPLKCHYVVAINKPLIDYLCLKSVSPNYRQFVSEKLLTTTVIHEIGHSIGIQHHGNDRVTNTYGVRDCAIRYTSDGEDLHPNFYVDMHRYCRSTETYLQYVPSDRPLSPNEQIPLDVVKKTAHGCWEQITVKSDNY